MDFADVLVVIPCLDEQEHLPALLAALRDDTPGALIVVADGGSTDGSRELVGAQAAEHPSIVLMDNPARLQSAGVNRAVVRHGAGKTWLVRVDAHCGCPRNYVATLVARARRGDVASVVVPMRTGAPGTRCFQRAVAAAQNSVLGTGGSLHRRVNGEGCMVDHGHHALMAIDRFLDVGGYCEQLSHNEDFELDHRLRRRGGAIWLEPAAAIDYYPRSSPGKLFRQYWNYGRGKATTAIGGRMALKLRQMLPLVVAPAALGGLIAPVVGVLVLPALGGLIAMPMLCWLLGVLGFGLLLGLRGRSGCEAVSGAAAIIMHLAWSLGFISVLLGRTRRPLLPGIPRSAPHRPGPEQAALPAR